MEFPDLKKKKKPTPYQQYMKINVPIIKRLNPTLTHKEAFRFCAKCWKDSLENPKNQKSF
jgi:hypothetical protein